MKKLVIFYSLDGNTRMIAEKITERTGADLLELKTEKEITRNNFLKIFEGGKQAILKARPKLLKFDFDVEKYDLIFFGTPVWAWTYAPALRTFFSEHTLQNKKIALFYCHGGGPGNFADKFKDTLKDNRILGIIGFKDPIKNDKENNILKLQEWTDKIMRTADQ
ncbi:MAG: flavodoxin [Candidatus Delongbacteria bacterium]